MDKKNLSLTLMLTLVFGLTCTNNLIAATAVAKLYELTSKNSVGTIEFSDNPKNKGLEIKTSLQLPGVSAGSYGFHIHANPSCEPALKNGKMQPGEAAGGHLDPSKSNKHLGPYNQKGHLGDLPALVVSEDGAAHSTLFAPRLKVSDVLNHAVMIHAGGDNFSDKPLPMGGGGVRKFCGVITAN
ncbi:MAG: superoxide dismutase family protein [Gammaproteobacteria bacterium]|nr:superoxide dismutase family protein [Gammaproteobacteria bacterium]